MPSRALRALVPIALVSVVGCGPFAERQPAVSARATIEPRSDLDPGQGCDRQLAVAKVHALFSALNAGDVSAVEKMFPNNATWHFTASPASGVAVSAGGGIRIEPRSDVKSRLLDAVNKNDVPALQKMFPAAGGWDFEVAPSIDAAIKGAARGSDDIRASSYPDLPNRVEMRKLLSQFSGLRLAFTTPLDGKGGRIEHGSPEGIVWVQEASPGPVLWQATGPRLQERGKKVMHGGGKIAIYCETGLFAKVGLGPMRIQ